MNKYVKLFLHRGLIFAGLGPIIAGVVFLILSFAPEGISLSGGQIFSAIVSTYMLAFLQAGASVFNQIEHWPVPKALLCHFLTIYVAYVSCYLANSWIPFEPVVIVIFTASFVVLYFIIWITVFLCVKAQSKRLNAKL